MKNKLRFIMPRLAGATAAAGMAALVIITLFKLLLSLTLLAGAITLTARSFARRQKQSGLYGQHTIPNFGNWKEFGNSSAGASSIQPVAGYATQQGTSIVPIN